jgi:uncharacterized protein YyaL (SSP411 family)
MTNYKAANRLISEKSPYLLQHAYNPVDWYPWGKEAFLKAKVEDKPIFLSIGYSTCHWCHVMERESFEDIEVADYLNKHFVSIKVDREERPDVDTIYMNVCQALTGSGGWPLTVIMTHDQKPFLAGTYFPKDDRMGLQGLMTILKAINNEWINNRELLLESGNRITEYISRDRKPSMANISEDIFDQAFFSFEQYFDPTYGGFGYAPKFPTPHNLMFLLRYWKHTKNPRSLQIVEKTLDSMYKGGIYDHIGFGFCRYSTDNKWLVPHFEKMLYDNALLAITYLETDKILTSWNGLMISAFAIAGRVLGEDKYTQAAVNAVNFILNNLIREDGRLLSRYRDGEAKHPAYLEDYAFFINGLLELYETTYKPDYLERAVSLSDDLLELFWDENRGGLFIYGNDGEQLITRPKEIYDGAIPSGNSVSALNFMKLSRLTGKFEFEERANQILRTFSDSISIHPISHSYSLIALLFSQATGQEIIISTDTIEKAKPYTDIINDKFSPFSVSMVYASGDEALTEIAPFLKSYEITPGETKVYVCEKHSCKAPVTDHNIFKEMLL